MGRAETALFHSRVHGLKAHRLATEVRSYEVPFGHVSLAPDITDKAAHSEANEALELAKYERDRDEVSTDVRNWTLLFDIENWTPGVK